MHSPFGSHRSLDPVGVLPQQASKLDASGPPAEDEVEIAVDYLNIDSASWHQIRQACDSDADMMRATILDIVADRGKMQNPITGSGGMLIGTVSALGSHRSDLEVGKRIASLVSLTLTPLELDRIVELSPSSEKIKVVGRAILFGSGLYSRMPEDMSEETALGVLDVCGAPAWVARLVEPGMKVVVIGAGGRSGLLAGAQAGRGVGDRGAVLGLCWPPETSSAGREVGMRTVAVDCTDPLAVLESVTEAFDGEPADLVIVCANVPGCEGGAILSCADDGRVLFFSMATSFSAAALTAEGLGKACEMTIGNGYLPGHAELALDLVRSEPALMKRFSH